MLAERAYIFPDTLPSEETLFPLVHFFAEAVYIAPVENDLPGPNELPPLAQELLTQGWLRFHCPAPLGADRERFLSLLNELRQRPGDYTGLALSGSSRGMESKSEIVSAVQRQLAGGSSTEAEEERARLLWQARLLLKLGELAERQEEEIRQSLRRLALHEHEILNRLRDTDDSPLDQRVNSDPADDSRRSRLRLKAWRKLLAFSSQPLLTNICITADQDAFEAVMEEPREARTILTLPLPAAAAGGDAGKQLNTFRQAAADLLNKLHRQPAIFADTEQDWSRLLEQHYPAEEHGRCRLVLHGLPGLRPQEFFGKQSPNPAQGNSAETILGILHQEK